MPIGSWRKRSASQNLNGMLLAEELPVALARCRLDGSGPPFPIEPPIRLGGRFGGRRSKLSADQRRTARKLYDERELTVAQIGKVLGVSRTSIYRALDKDAAAVAAAETGRNAGERLVKVLVTVAVPAAADPEDAAALGGRRCGQHRTGRRARRRGGGPLAGGRQHRGADRNRRAGGGAGGGGGHCPVAAPGHGLSLIHI